MLGSQNEFRRGMNEAMQTADFYAASPLVLVGLPTSLTPLSRLQLGLKLTKILKTSEFGIGAIFPPTAPSPR